MNCWETSQVFQNYSKITGIDGKSHETLIHWQILEKHLKNTNRMFVRSLWNFYKILESAPITWSWEGNHPFKAWSTEISEPKNCWMKENITLSTLNLSTLMWNYQTEIGKMQTIGNRKFDYIRLISGFVAYWRYMTTMQQQCCSLQFLRLLFTEIITITEESSNKILEYNA